MKTQHDFKRVRKEAFHRQMPVEVRPAKKHDLAGILNVEWFCFPNELDGRFRPGHLLFWYKYIPAMFGVAEVGAGDILGYSCLVPLTETGFHKYASGQQYSIVGLELADVDVSVQPRYLSLEVVACINPEDTAVGALLFRDVMRRIPQSCEIFTAMPASRHGQRLVERFHFKLLWRKLVDGAFHQLYMLDLRNPIVRAVVRKFR